MEIKRWNLISPFDTHASIPTGRGAWQPRVHHVSGATTWKMKRMSATAWLWWKDSSLWGHRPGNRNMTISMSVWGTRRLNTPIYVICTRPASSAPAWQWKCASHVSTSTLAMKCHCGRVSNFFIIEERNRDPQSRSGSQRMLWNARVPRHDI